MITKEKLREQFETEKNIHNRAYMLYEKEYTTWLENLCIELLKTVCLTCDEPACYGCTVHKRVCTHETTHDEPQTVDGKVVLYAEVCDHCNAHIGNHEPIFDPRD